ncbi:hypothetical protein VNO78_02248 [Psophocarpus tetragonolobus]|uniref:Uncharacterized protein n=1 Tax=Psophocarpus tetragonolobus TaxID=3891 RepID=A0AAN9XUN3_PSOTE
MRGGAGSGGGPAERVEVMRDSKGREKIKNELRVAVTIICAMNKPCLIAANSAIMLHYNIHWKSLPLDALQNYECDGPSYAKCQQLKGTPLIDQKFHYT